MLTSAIATVTLSRPPLSFAASTSEHRGGSAVAQVQRAVDVQVRGEHESVSDAVEANFSTRAKMGQSSDVYAVALTTDGKALFAKKEVKVTLGGCGG